jgi:pyrrolidone-carboxylate peptidase
VINTDPGRYLCNYVYFSSLNELKCDKKNVDCLFVHFPPLAVKSHEQNMSFVK